MPIRRQSLDEIWKALDVFETLFVTDTPSCPTVCRCFGRAWVHLCTNNSLSAGSVEKVTMPGRSTELCTYSRSPCLGTGRPKAAGNLLLPSAVRAFFCLKHIPTAVSISEFDIPCESLPGVDRSFPLLAFLGLATYICLWRSLASSARSLLSSVSYPMLFAANKCFQALL